MRTYSSMMAVIASGASVLALELLGTRLLAPIYGLSLFLWAAQISVTLAALSAGYAWGGSIADRSDPARSLVLSLGVAGIVTVLIPVASGPLMSLFSGVDLRWGIMLSSTLLFGPPLVLMGMTLPLALKLQTTDLGHIGRVSGRLIAVSTVASVGSALLVGAYLIHLLSLPILFGCVGGLLIVTAALLSFQHRRAIPTTLLLIFGISVAGSAVGARSTPRGTGLTMLTER